MDESLAVTFYTRPGCGLCETTAAVLRSLTQQFPLDITVVDISADAAAHDRWWADIPVVEVGATVLRAPISYAQLRMALLHELRATV